MLLHELTLRGILSFGPDTPPLPLQPLNVLIGPNGSGKSNLVESIGLLRSTPGKLTAPLRGPGGGTVKEWIWKGAKNGHAFVEAVIDFPAGAHALRHRIEFTDVPNVQEAVVVLEKHDGQTQAKRLQATQEMQQWLRRYRLGQLWTRGEIGGTRW